MKNHTAKYSNEEEVKIQLVLPWLEKLGYKRDLMEFEKTITIQEGRKSKSIFADIVVYTDKNKVTPLGSLAESVGNSSPPVFFYILKAKTNII